MLDLD
jgi:hypothetical protein